MKAADVMTSPVLTVGAAAAIEDAAQLLVQHSVNTLPVVDADGRLVGVVTETDVFRALALRMGIGLSPTARLDLDHVPRRVADIAHANDIRVKPDDEVSFCLLLMARNDGKSLPVLDQGRVVGIISRREALSALSSGAALDIETIRARINEGQLPDMHDAPAAT